MATLISNPFKEGDISLNDLTLMKKEEFPDIQRVKILECFMQSLMQKGVKATTMDSIASTLRISKRTLYEIFGNKEDLFREAHIYFHIKIGTELKKIFSESENVMEGIIKCFLYNRDLMSNVNADFIREIDNYGFKHQISETAKRQYYQNLYDVLKRGVDEGYFREDVNLMVQCHILTLQMQALKKSEALLQEFTLLEVFDSIILGFLRGISSPKGLMELERFTPEISRPTAQNEL